MTTDQIIEAAVAGNRFSVFNSPFAYKGKITLTLEGGEELYWVFSEDERILSIHTGTEEVIAFSPLSEELSGGETEVSGDEEAMVHLGKEYEFSYEDQGKITELDGASEYDVDEQIVIRDYESEEGEIMRQITSEQTGDKLYLLGTKTLDDDIFLIS